VVLTIAPAVVPATVTETVQLPLMAIEPPANDRTCGGPVASAAVPPQVLVTVPEADIPDGMVSETPTPVSATALLAGLVMVRVNVEVDAGTFSSTLVGTKVF